MRKLSGPMKMIKVSLRGDTDDEEKEDDGRGVVDVGAAWADDSVDGVLVVVDMVA